MARITTLQHLPLRGAETCFNGLDDNQNSFIDEGCGFYQSPLQFMLAWEGEGIDCDLFVTDPEGEIAQVRDGTNLGLTSLADCPAEESSCVKQHFEYVYLEEEEIPPGSYLVQVRLEEAPVALTQVHATLGVRLPDATMAFDVVFERPGQEGALEFEVASVNDTD